MPKPSDADAVKQRSSRVTRRKPRRGDADASYMAAQAAQVLLERIAVMTPADALAALQAESGARALLGGVDTIYLTIACALSDTVYERLDSEKRHAQTEAKAGRVHCPDWLGARVLPKGADGTYVYLIETEDFTVKVLGAGVRHRPGLAVELRSHFLHVHPSGAPGACEEALCWVRAILLYDLDPDEVMAQASFAAAMLSRVDIHLDWQGGYAPTLADVGADLQRLVRPGAVMWGFYGSGNTPTGYTFGQGHVRARLYNKTVEARKASNDAYFALLVERNGDAYDDSLDVWRLEFQLRREGIKGFKLYAEPDADDDDDAIEAEVSAEDLQHVGALPRFFPRMNQLWLHLTQHWLRLVVDNGTQRRSRWPLDPTWAYLRAAFGPTAGVPPLTDDGLAVVRGLRYSGRNRLLRRMTLGVVSSLEVEDASPTSAALASLESWVEKAAEQEARRAEARREHYLETTGSVPRWVEHGMGERLHRVEQMRHRVQMLLGIYAAQGVLPLEFKPTENVADLLIQHLGELEDEADAKGGIQELLRARFAKTYKTMPPQKRTMPGVGA